MYGFGRTLTAFEPHAKRLRRPHPFMDARLRFLAGLLDWEKMARPYLQANRFADRSDRRRAMDVSANDHAGDFSLHQPRESAVSRQSRIRWRVAQLICESSRYQRPSGRVPLGTA